MEVSQLRTELWILVIRECVLNWDEALSKKSAQSALFFFKFYFLHVALKEGHHYDSLKSSDSVLLLLSLQKMARVMEMDSGGSYCQVNLFRAPAFLKWKYQYLVPVYQRLYHKRICFFFKK